MTLSHLPPDLARLLTAFVEADDACTHAAIAVATHGPHARRAWVNTGTMKREAELALIEWTRAHAARSES